MEVIDVNKENEKRNSMALQEQECVPFHKAADLMGFMDTNDMLMHMTEQEAEVLLNCMEGHGILLGHRGEEIVCLDLCSGEKNENWKIYSIDDAIKDACDYNYDMILQAQRELSGTGDYNEYEQRMERLNLLQADEQVLDSMFDRTKHGKEVESLAQELVGEFIRDIRSKGDIDQAVQKIMQAIVPDKKLFSEAGIQLKQDQGRVR